MKTETSVCVGARRVIVVGNHADRRNTIERSVAAYFRASVAAIAAALTRHPPRGASLYDVLAMAGPTQASAGGRRWPGNPNAPKRHRKFKGYQRTRR